MSVVGGTLNLTETPLDSYRVGVCMSGREVCVRVLEDVRACVGGRYACISGREGGTHAWMCEWK